MSLRGAEAKRKKSKEMTYTMLKGAIPLATLCLFLNILDSLTHKLTSLLPLFLECQLRRLVPLKANTSC